MKTQRLIYVDYLKTISILMVVFYHCGFGEVYVKTLYSICCPIFFAVNGYFMLNKKRTTKEIIKKNVKILFLMIFWSFTLTSMMMLIRNNFTIYDFARNVFYLGQGYCNHLWFIGALFVLNLFYLLIVGFIHDFWHNYILLLLFCILCCLDLPKYLAWQFNPLSGWFYRFSLCYFVLGYVFWSISDLIKSPLLY